VSAWPPDETPVESASQCDGAVGIPVPAVEPGISRLTLVGDRASSAGPQNTISQIPPNTATAPIRGVGWELSSELLTWYFSGEVFTFRADLGKRGLAGRLLAG
jgi:hypothetical protein